MSLKIEILCQNFAHFGRFEGSFLTILGVKKVDFAVLALFSASKGLLLGIF